MSGEEDSPAGIMGQAVQEVQQFHLAGIIEESRRFVEEDDRCLLCQGFCDDYFLSLSIAERS